MKKVQATPAEIPGDWSIRRAPRPQPEGPTITIRGVQLECVDPYQRSDKFYRMYLIGEEGGGVQLLLKQWGRRGTQGQFKVERGDSAALAGTYRGVAWEKIDKGYEVRIETSWSVTEAQGSELVSKLTNGRKALAEAADELYEMLGEAWADSITPPLVLGSGVMTDDNWKKDAKRAAFIVSDLDTALRVRPIAREIRENLKVWASRKMETARGGTYSLVEVPTHLLWAVGIIGAENDYIEPEWANSIVFLEEDDTEDLGEFCLRVLDVPEPMKFEEALELARSVRE